MIVIDASVAVKWVLAEADSAKAAVLRSHDIAVPSLWLAEVANALWRLVRLSRLSEPEAISRFQQVAAVPVVTVPTDKDAAETLSLAIALDHPVYDCFYLALAARERTQLVTADARFASLVRRHGKWAAHIKLLSET